MRPTVKATLAIATTGSVGTAGLDTALTVSARDAGTGSATASDYSFTTTTLTFAAGSNGSTIDSSSATVSVLDDRRVDGDETVKLLITGPSSTLNGQVSIVDGTH